MNFDAAFCNSLSTSGKGVIVCDSNGSILLTCSFFHQNVSTIFAAEALTALDAIKIRSVFGFQKSILEVDSLTTIKKCLSNSLDLSEISPLIGDIKTFGRSFQDLQFRYTDRSAKKVADALAKEALKKDSGHTWRGSNTRA